MVHIEVQGYADKDFSERMFRYFYRIFDRYNEKIVSLALITGSEKEKSEGKFEFKAYGSGVEFHYLSPKLMVYDKEELEKSNNPIALVVLACQGREKARAKGEAYNIKLQLIRSMYEKNYSKDDIKALFEFIDWVIVLGDEEEDFLLDEIKKIEEVKKMPYVSHLERIIRKKAIKEGREKGIEEGIKEGIKQGLEKGIKEGKERGIKEGIKQGIRESIFALLQLRFGTVSQEVSDYINSVKDEEQLRLLHRKAVKCLSIDEFMQTSDDEN